MGERINISQGNHRYVNAFVNEKTLSFHLSKSDINKNSFEEEYRFILSNNRYGFNIYSFINPDSYRPYPLIKNVSNREVFFKQMYSHITKTISITNKKFVNFKSILNEKFRRIYEIIKSYFINKFNYRNIEFWNTNNYIIKTQLLLLSWAYPSLEPFLREYQINELSFLHRSVSSKFRTNSIYDSVYQLFGTHSKKMVNLLTETMFGHKKYYEELIKNSDGISKYNAINQLPILLTYLVKKNVPLDYLHALLENTNFMMSGATLDEHILNNLSKTNKFGWFYKFFSHFSFSKIIDLLINIENKTTISNHVTYIYDSVNMWKQLKENNIDFDFKHKSYRSIVELHNDLAREHRRMTVSEFKIDIPFDLKNIHNFSYEQIEFFAPETNYDLIDWSCKMNNCISSYAERAFNHKVQLLAVKINNDIKYNLELKDRQIKSFLGKHNHTPNEKDEFIIVSILLKSYAIDYNKNNPFIIKRDKIMKNQNSNFEVIRESGQIKVYYISEKKEKLLLPDIENLEFPKLYMDKNIKLEKDKSEQDKTEQHDEVNPYYEYQFIL